MKESEKSCLANLLIAVVFGGLIVWGIRSCDRWITPPIAPAGEKPATVRDILQKDRDRRQAQAEREAAKAQRLENQAAEREARWKAEEAKQETRLAWLKEIGGRGAFSKIDWRENGATLWVRPEFYLLAFDDKQKICSVAHAYLATAARDEYVIVRLRDANSGKVVGIYSVTGLEME